MPTLPDIVLPDPNDKNLSQLLSKKGQYLSLPTLPYIHRDSMFFTSQLGDLHLKNKICVYEIAYFWLSFNLTQGG